MKDETGGVLIHHFCGCRTRMHAYIKENKEFDCKGNGVNKNVRMKETQEKCRHKLNKCYCEYNIYQISSCYDDKRCILNDGVNTLTYEHKNYK